MFPSSLNALLFLHPPAVKIIPIKENIFSSNQFFSLSQIFPKQTFLPIGRQKLINLSISHVRVNTSSDKASPSPGT